MICVPIKKKIIKALIKLLVESQEQADLTEIYFDELTKLTESNLKKIFAIKEKAFLYKSYGEIEKILKVLKNGVEYIDLDLKTDKKIIIEIKKQFPETKIIISHHDFEKTPSDKTLRSIIKKMQEKGADIVKLAVTAKELYDSLRIFALLEELKSKKQKAICLAMGKEGAITRAAGHLFGNYLMYAPIETADNTAAGQISLSDLKKIKNLIK